MQDEPNSIWGLLLQIRVNAVNPTVVLTDMGRLGWSDPKKAKPMLDQIPLGRFAGNCERFYSHETQSSEQPTG